MSKRRTHPAVKLLAGLIVLFWIMYVLPYVPGLLRSRIAANEASAAWSVRNMNTALATYKREHAVYPENVFALRGLLDDTIACAQPPCLKSGYRFTYKLLPPDASGPRYTIVARPNNMNTGTRSFFMDQTGVIRYTVDDRDATAKDSPLE